MRAASDLSTCLVLVTTFHEVMPADAFKRGPSSQALSLGRGIIVAEPLVSTDISREHF